MVPDRLLPLAGFELIIVGRFCSDHRGLNAIRQKRGVPKLLFCDNGSEFTSQIMDLWAYHNRLQIDFSRPGKPTDNAHVESFNGTFRAECLDVHWFMTHERLPIS